MLNRLRQWWSRYAPDAAPLPPECHVRLVATSTGRPRHARPVADPYDWAEDQ
jgi:hypothetical protein